MASCSFVAASTAAQAQAVWTGTTSADWFDMSNWNTNAVPMAGDTVNIGTMSPNATAIDGANASAGGVAVGVGGGDGWLSAVNGGTLSASDIFVGYGVGLAGAVTVDGPGSAISGGGIAIGYWGSGLFNVTDGGTVSNAYTAIGALAGSVGVVNVSGTGSSWMSSGSLDVGDYGDGSLSITAGGEVQNAAGRIGVEKGSSGAVMVSGAGSLWTNTGGVFVGLNGEGELTVSDGGTVSASGGVIASTSSSIGVATVDGAGSTWSNAGSLTVGASGTGSLTISNGGAVSNTTAVIGSDVTGEGTVLVDGSGSTWTNTSMLAVGNMGSGKLTIANGGTVTNTDGRIGNQIGSTGEVTVDGSGSSWISSGNVFVGLGGDGALTISNGGTVSSASAILASANNEGTAILTGAGSTWTNTGSLVVGFWGAGNLSILDGAAMTSNTISLGINPSAFGNLIVDGAGSSLFGNDLGLYNGSVAISNGGTIATTTGTIAGTSSTAGIKVEGTGSTWTNSGNLNVATIGAASLEITDGASVSNALGTVGINAGSNGSVLVEGAGTSWTNSSTLRIGYAGTGTLTLSDGATVSAGGAGIALAIQAGSTGTINIGTAAGQDATAAGTLTGPSGLHFGDGTGTLNFNHTDAGYVFGTPISGFGTINQLSGATSLVGDSSGFTGTTSITGGSLYVNGMLGGAVNVSGGLLGGSGTLGDVTVGSGIIGPGNSIGTLNVANLTIDPGAFYEVELDDGGFVAGTNNDLINASGTVTINGGTVHVTPENGTDTGLSYTPGTYTIATAGTGVSGTFDAVSDDYAFLNFVLSYDLNNVYLTSSALDFFCLADMSANQCATGDGAFSLGSGDLFDAVVMLADAEAPIALDLLSGEIHASAKTALIEDSRFAREAALDRIRKALAATGHAGTGVWMQGFGANGEIDGDGNASTLSRSTGGLFIGADGEVYDNWNFGLLAGYSHSSFSVDDRASSGSADSYHLGAYGGARWNDLALRLGGAYSWHDIEVDRSVAFTGFSDDLSSDYWAGTGQLFGELAYGIDVGSAHLEPFANLAWVRHSTDGFTENGGAAALTGADDVINATFTTLGLRASTELAMGEGTGARLAGMVGWRHAFGDAPTATHALAGGSAFTVTGAPLGQDALVLEAGLDLDVTSMATLGLNYSGQIGSGVADHALKANLGVKF